MKLRIVKAILQKELLDTVRDKRTLIMMLGVPVVLYPLLMLVGVQVLMLQQQKLEARETRAAVVPAGAEQLREWVAGIENVRIEDVENAELALAQRQLDVVVRSSAGDVEHPLAQGQQVQIELLYDTTEPQSVEGLERVRAGLEEVEKEIRRDRLAAYDLELSYIDPIEAETEDVAPPARASGNLLGALLPFIMVTMIALGAFYPAVDLTAGEKERGTFETLLSTPASKAEIVTGKFFTVLLLSIATGLLNLLSMGAAVMLLFRQVTAGLPEAAQIPFELPVRAFFVILVAIIPLALFISALMMDVAVLARSFKEAQNYLTPFFLVLMMPALAAAVPGTELTFVGQFIPIYNVVLLFRELLVGKAGWDAVFIVMLSTTALAVLALQLAVWLFQREDVVLSEERGLPLSVRRADFVPRAHPTPGMSLGLYVVLMLGLFYIATPLQQWRVFPGLLITEWVLLAGVTIGALVFVRVNLRTGLNLRTPRVLSLIGGVLAAIGAIVLLIQANVWHNRVLPMPPEIAEEMQGLFAGAETLPGLLWIIFVVAVSPAVCEELLFRGAILSGLRTRLGPVVCTVLVGFLFGLFHLSIYKLLPTALLGMLLTWLVIRTGSVYVGMAAHVLNNGLAILLSTGWLPISEAQLEVVEAGGVPAAWLLGAAVLLTAGIALVEWSARRKRVEAGAP